MIDRTQKSKLGFTLIEMIVIMTILSILAGASVPLFNRYISKAEDAVSISNAYPAFQKYLLEHITSAPQDIMLVYQDAPDQILAFKHGRMLSDVFSSIPHAISVLTEGLDDKYGIFSTSTEKLYVVKEGASTWDKARIVFVGDSITAGNGTNKTYHAYINEMADFASVQSMGIAGSCISRQSDYGSGNSPLIGRYTSIPDAEIIAVFMGTNDYGHETPLGSISDATDISFFGALNVIIPGILTQHPNSQLIFITPLHRYGFGTSKLTGIPFTFDYLPNGRGHTLSDYVSAIKAVCAKYSVPVIDLHNLCPINPAHSSDQTAYFPDGLHPNAAGHEIVASTILDNLQWIPRAGSGTSGEQNPDNNAPTSSPNVPMIHGNKFVSHYVNDPTRASSEVNIYLTSGQTVIFKNPDKYQWALAKTESINSTHHSQYYPNNGWNTASSYTVAADSYYGLVLWKNDGSAFDFNGPDPSGLIDYLHIE